MLFHLQITFLATIGIAVDLGDSIMHSSNNVIPNYDITFSIVYIVFLLLGSASSCGPEYKVGKGE